MDIKRLLLPQLKAKLESNKIVLLYGPRRVGKTYLLQKLIADLGQKEKIKLLNGENRITQEELSAQVVEKLKSLVGETTLLIVDEAQKIPNIGLNLKLIVDHFAGVKVIASGSASFSLAQKVGEPLTGRKKTLKLYPIACAEIIQTLGEEFQKSTLENQLIFGSYPEIFSLGSSAAKAAYLTDLVDSLLLKDILELEYIRKSKKLIDLLTLLAFQIGKEVSLSELGNALDLHKDTVAHYLDLLEQAFILINIRGFARNLRKEVTKNSRYYFYDNGIRNALINNFNFLKLRDDVGMLWENYLVVERLKKQSYTDLLANNYFWRTYDQKEIDWVEMRQGKLYGYEIKWGTNLKSRARKEWLKTYKEGALQIVNKDNYLDFIL